MASAKHGSDMAQSAEWNGMKWCAGVPHHITHLDLQSPTSIALHGWLFELERLVARRLCVVSYDRETIVVVIVVTCDDSVHHCVVAAAQQSCSATIVPQSRPEVGAAINSELVTVRRGAATN